MSQKLVYFVSSFSYAIYMDIHKSTPKTLVELLSCITSITKFQSLVMVSDSENKIFCQDLDKIVKEAKVPISKAQKITMFVL